MSVLAATLTTMGALVIIFFLDEKIRLNLQDFAAVVIINLAVSLFVALFFVPAMIDRIKLVKRQSVKRWVRSHIRIRRLTVYFTNIAQAVLPCAVSCGKACRAAADDDQINHGDFAPAWFRVARFPSS